MTKHAVYDTVYDLFEGNDPFYIFCPNGFQIDDLIIGVVVQMKGAQSFFLTFEEDRCIMYIIEG
ncbi:MAG: hypothetical protein O7G87_05940 [bacterium]|nr:hypothetical protein [bacterium]